MRASTVIAVMGAAAGLGGLGLVFLGLVISSRQAYAADVGSDVTGPFAKLAWGLVAVFSLGVAVVALALGWLVNEGGDTIFWTMIGLFSVQLFGIVIGAIIATDQTLR